MRKLMQFIIPVACAMLLLVGVRNHVTAQGMPEELQTGTLNEQFNYLQQRTIIYNGYRAIREDMFRQISRNSIDSLARAYAEVRLLNENIVKQQAIIDSLGVQFQETSLQRDEAIRERDSLSIMGILVNKTFYNVLLWSIIAALAFIAVVVFLYAKKAHSNALNRENELTGLKSEFEDYKKTSRERFEKQSIDHFNELKRLKGL